MKSEIFNIKKDYENVYYFLKDNNFSERTITSLRKEQGLIKINGKNATTKTILNIDDTLEISLPEKPSKFLETQQDPEIIFEDDYLLLINKPSGISCMPTRSHYDKNLAGQILYYMKKKDKNFTLRMINRLDKDTAGILIIPKDIITYQNIKKINKKYHALCAGIIDKNAIVDKKILTVNYNGINQLKRIISEEGKEAKTFIKPIKIYKENTLIELEIEHGRTHQIRVHLSSINHSLLGDEIYGIKSDKINHTALICKEVSFIHPRTNKKMNFSIDYPDDFKSLLK